jgi:hypothetical protein
MADDDSSSVDFVRGDATGLSIPAHGEALREADAAFLTDAFRAFGSLSADNRVTRISRLEPCAGGSTGAKLFLTVDYAIDEPGLHTELFVKFSRDFADARRDWQRHEMESEARFATISRLPDFPISVPTAYFADYHHESGTGLVITERIPFGAGAIEPHRRKCLDHLTLEDPLPYYRATVTALARLAGAHKAGRLAPDIGARFPFDPVTASADPIRSDQEKLRARLAECADFAARCPQLLPAEVRTPEFLAAMTRDALRIYEHEATIQRYLRGNPDLIALCHWNAHIDNGWFWRDEAGALHCGLIDWGRVGQITFGSALWGGLSGAHHDIWDHHLGELLALFVRVYREQGGPAITVEELEFHLTLHMAAMGVARMLIFPEVILFRLPAAEQANGPLDPMFEGVDPARNSLHIYTVFLKYWRRRDFGACLDRLLERIATAPPENA